MSVARNLFSPVLSVDCRKSVVATATLAMFCMIAALGPALTAISANHLRLARPKQPSDGLTSSAAVPSLNASSRAAWYRPTRHFAGLANETAHKMLRSRSQESIMSRRHFASAQRSG